MIFLACDWIVTPQMTLSELAQISDNHNADLVFIGEIFVDKTGLYRLKFAIKGEAARLQKFTNSLPKAFEMNNWYSVTEAGYEQGTLFSEYWDDLKYHIRSGWLDAIGRFGFSNREILDG